jgi:hypothetical protein
MAKKMSDRVRVLNRVAENEARMRKIEGLDREEVNTLLLHAEGLAEVNRQARVEWQEYANRLELKVKKLERALRNS